MFYGFSAKEEKVWTNYSKLLLRELKKQWKNWFYGKEKNWMEKIIYLATVLVTKAILDAMEDD